MLEVKSLEQLKSLRKNNTFVFVDFYATWCKPCKKIEPTIIDLSTQYSNVVFCKVDVDHAKDITSKYKIKCMPTFLLFTEGKYIRTEGADVEKITAILKKTI